MGMRVREEAPFLDTAVADPAANCGIVAEEVRIHRAGMGCVHEEGACVEDGMADRRRVHPPCGVVEEGHVDDRVPYD
jgi:hypothetical protein